MSKLRKLARSGGETRTYKITGKPETLDKLENLLSDMQALGSMGASRGFDLFVDGDGAFWIEVKKDKGEMAKTDIVNDHDDDTFKYSFD